MNRIRRRVPPPSPCRVLPGCKPCGMFRLQAYIAAKYFILNGLCPAYLISKDLCDFTGSRCPFPFLTPN